MVSIELCVSSLEAIELAGELKLNRVEICQNLESGGLTPSSALVEKSLELGLDTHVLIRPRVGGFVYKESELKLILHEIDYFARLGVQGVVFGALLPDHRVNTDFIDLVRADFPKLNLTFHKAFDDTPDWRASIDSLVKSGINRILTAGCEAHVIKGISTLKAIFEYAADRIEILPGGGLNENNIEFFIKNIQPEWMHFSGCKKILDRSSSNYESVVLQLDKEGINKMIKLAESYSFSMGAISSAI
jgi:copper homeostasis protein